MGSRFTNTPLGLNRGRVMSVWGCGCGGGKGLVKVVAEGGSVGSMPASGRDVTAPGGGRPDGWAVGG